MAFDVRCPSCNAKMHAADKLAGKKVKCLKCSGVIHLPTAPSPAEPPPLPAGWANSEPAREGQLGEVLAADPPATVPGQGVATRPRWAGRLRFALTAVAILAVLTAVVSYLAATRPPSSTPVSDASAPLGESKGTAQLDDVQRLSDEELLASYTSSKAIARATSAEKPKSAAAAAIAPTREKPTSSPEKSLDPAALYAKCSPAVATIVTKDDLGFDACQGSGFFVDPDFAAQNYKGFAIRQELAKESRGKPGGPYQDAYLLTNHHVIESAATAEVRLQDGRSGTVDDVVVEDEDLDLALLSVTIWDSPTPLPTLAFVEQAARKKSGPVEHLGGRDPVSEALSGVAVGEKVYAIGSPKGLEASLSEGIISGKREVRPDVWCLQTTAPVSGGSSGGPLLDSGGRVLGVVRASRRSAQNLNFAVPAVHAINVLSGPYNTRAIWRGTSVRGEAADAYISANVALRDNKAVVEGWKVGVLLDEVNRDLRKNTAGKARSVLARAAPSLFGEHEYLMHYTVGRCAHARVVEPKNARTVAEFRQMYRDNADLQLAKREYRKCTELNPEFSPAYERLGGCLLSEANNKEGLRVADLLVKLMPRCTSAYKLRGAFHGELRRHVEAREDFRKAVELGANDPESHWELAVECIALDEHAEAIEAYQAAMQLKCRAWKLCPIHIGHAYKKMGKWELALKYFEQAKALGDTAEFCDPQIAECKRRLKGDSP